MIWIHHNIILRLNNIDKLNPIILIQKISKIVLAVLKIGKNKLINNMNLEKFRSIYKILVIKNLLFNLIMTNIL